MLELSPLDQELLMLLALGYDNAGLDAAFAGRLKARRRVEELRVQAQAKNRVHLLALCHFDGQLPIPGTQVAEIARIAQITLTDREHNLLWLLASGYEQEEAAERMGLNVDTWRSYQTALLKRLGVPETITHRPRRQYAVCHCLWAGTLKLDRPLVDPATPRERDREYIRRVAAAQTDSEIGRAMGGMLPTTADGEITRIVRKLGCRDRVQMVRLAFQRNWIAVPEAAWPSVARVLESPPDEQERQLLVDIEAGVSRATAKQRIGMSEQTYRKLQGGLFRRWQLPSSRQALLMAFVAAEAVRNAAYLPVGARFSDNTFVPTSAQNTIVAGLASGSTIQVLSSGLGLWENEINAEIEQMKGFFEVNSLWHLMSVMHECGKLPVPLEPAGRTVVLGWIIQPPPPPVRIGLAALASGTDRAIAIGLSGLTTNNFQKSLRAAGAASLAHAVALYCWAEDSWRGR
jgi:DNA-binding CsgD family transcriptional regulator